MEKLKAFVAEKHAYLDKYGLHIMMTQNSAGEIALGDSQEYGDAITPFDSAAINQTILDEARRYFILKDWSPSQTWHGICAHNKNGEDLVKEVMPNVHIVTAFGTMGMTMAFGLAEKAWDSWTAAGSSKNTKAEKVAGN